MASRLETAEYICDQIYGAGEVRYKKMFGEYMVYLNDRPIFLICDDTLFAKINEQTRLFCGEAEEACPYDGAKPHYVVDFIDDRERLQGLASIFLAAGWCGRAVF